MNDDALINTPNTEVEAVPVLVAHRGYQKKFPENTLDAINAAYEHNISHIEIDIQFSRDKHAMVYHDDSLNRVSDLDELIFKVDADQLLQLEANERGRLGSLHSGVMISSLSQVVRWLRARSDALLFIEIKPENLDRITANEAIDIVLGSITDVARQCIIISFSEQIISALNQRKQAERTEQQPNQQAAQQVASGLVITSWTQYKSGAIKGLEPDFVFCNHRKVPRRFRFDTDSWNWVLYEIGNLKTLRRFYDRGCHYFESFDAPGLLEALEI
jgi:glycerophosphoryl diester phosphodiesterase